MENIIEAITANPVYLAIAVVLAIVVVYGFIKKIHRFCVRSPYDRRLIEGKHLQQTKGSSSFCH